MAEIRPSEISEILREEIKGFEAHVDVRDTGRVLSCGDGIARIYGLQNAAAGELLGEHDFAAFCRRREGATTVRALRRLDWQRDADGVAVACVVADAFCHNMVRALVGALLPVGDGSRPAAWPSMVLAAAVRDPAVRVVPPHGLCLEEVRYPEAAELAARAALTRRLRD